MRLYIGYVEHYVVIQPYDAAEVFFKSPPALTEGRLLLVAIAKQHLCPDCFKGVTPPNSIGNLDQPVHGLGVTVRNLEIEVVENRVMPVSNRGGKFIEVRHQLRTIGQCITPEAVLLFGLCLAGQLVQIKEHLFKHVSPAQQRDITQPGIEKQLVLRCKVFVSPQEDVSIPHECRFCAGVMLTLRDLRNSSRPLFAMRTTW